MPRFLRKNMRGPDVKKWQLFLIGKGYTEAGAADGVFGDDTEAATRRFQQDQRLDVDGAVGNLTMGKAMTLGFGLLEDTNGSHNTGTNFPPRPNFDPVVTNAARAALFGRFAYRHEPVPGNPENIRITDGWEQRNIETLSVPQLAGVRGAGAAGRARFHRSAARQFLALWRAWDDAGLLGRVHTWDGAFVPRFSRGSRTALSNHAFGSAFDINYRWNQLGSVPARVGRQGCVRELVEIANQHGFFWGGHYRRRPDGMHFEVARLM